MRYAVPVTWGMTAGRPPLSTVPSTVAVNVLPTMESCRSTVPAGRRPPAARAASRAQVPEPYGDRSASPSAKIVTLQHTQVSAVVVGRHDESAVHVRMAARFAAQHGAQALNRGIFHRPGPPLGTVRPGIGTGGSATIRNGSPPVW